METLFQSTTAHGYAIQINGPVYLRDSANMVNAASTSLELQIPGKTRIELRRTMTDRSENATRG